MTTATDPPLIDEPSIGVDEMPALDQPDERVCEIVDRLCRKAAAWVISGTCPSCPRTETRLACDEHKRLLVEGGAQCRPFLHDVVLTQVEPLR